jgi:hypothetical protein
MSLQISFGKAFESSNSTLVEDLAHAWMTLKEIFKALTNPKFIGNKENGDIEEYTSL